MQCLPLHTSHHTHLHKPSPSARIHNVHSYATNLNASFGFACVHHASIAAFYGGNHFMLPPTQSQHSSTSPPVSNIYSLLNTAEIKPCSRRQSVVPNATASKGGLRFSGQGFKEDLGTLTPQPAFQATLRMLEWHRICEHLATFASTSAGKQACLNLGFPRTEEGSQLLLHQTRAAIVLQYDYAVSLDFGGIDSQGAASAIARAQKAGMCSAQQLRAAAALAVGADRIRKQVLSAARENEGGRAFSSSPLAPLIAAVSRLAPQPVFVRDVHACISEENNVQDSASDSVSRCRLRVRSITSKLTNLLKGYGGEVSEQGGRICVAMPAGSKLAPGILMLGTSQGGSLMYVEPSAAVSLNNELAAAKGECYSAEEDVLWGLTNQMMGVLEELECMYEVVIWLDLLSSKARYAVWVNGVLPTLVPWTHVFHARGARAAKQRTRAQNSAGGAGPEDSESNGGNWDDDGGWGADEDPNMSGRMRYAVCLRGLRHPLLLGDYLKEKERLVCALRQAGGDPALLEAISAASGSNSKGAKISKARQEMMEAAGFGSARGPRRARRGASREEQQEQINALTDALLKLTPPVPLDFLIKPHISAVVITGPNTGGKTATMKALGLSALMARAGLAIPADQPASLPAYSSVLADIGDEQSLTANLSTFSGHLARIQACRAEADGRSLMLLDELGTGTDPVEGAALGVALLKRMAAGGTGSGALTIATTHHSLMTSLKFEDEQGRFENASVEFDEVALAPTYHLLWGIPGRSNAINIAARLGLNPEVVKAAQAGRDTSLSVADNTIKDLEEARIRLKDEEAARRAVEHEVVALQQQVERKRNEAEAIRKELQAARNKSLLDVWVAARQRLRELQKKKVVTPPRSQPAAAAPLAKQPQQDMQDRQPQHTQQQQQQQQQQQEVQSNVGEQQNELEFDSEEEDEDDEYILPPRVSGKGAQGLLPIEEYLDMSQDVLDLQTQLETKMLERDQWLKAQSTSQEEMEILSDIVNSLESREQEARPQPSSQTPKQQPVIAQERADESMVEAGVLEHWMEPQESEPQFGAEPSRQAVQDDEAVGEEALMLFALEQLEGGRPGGLGMDANDGAGWTSGSRSRTGQRGERVQASTVVDDVDNEELELMHIVEQMERHQQVQRGQQQRKGQVRGRGELQQQRRGKFGKQHRRGRSRAAAESSSSSSSSNSSQ